MVNYKVTVATTDLATANTFNNVYIKLVGTDGESERTWLIGLKGPLSFIRGAFAASGGEGVITLMKRSLSSVTYRSLCIPDNISDRGLEDVPNFYYRDDGLKLWEIWCRLR